MLVEAWWRKDKIGKGKTKGEVRNGKNNYDSAISPLTLLRIFSNYYSTFTSHCKCLLRLSHDIVLWKVASVGKKRKYKNQWEERISNRKDGSNNNNSKQCNSTLVRRNSAYLKMHLPPILTCVVPMLVKSILLKDCKNKNKKPKLRKCQILMQKLDA